MVVDLWTRIVTSPFNVDDRWVKTGLRANLTFPNKLIEKLNEQADKITKTRDYEKEGDNNEVMYI